MPWIAEHVRLGVAELGIALAMPAVGALVSMPFSGRVVERLGGRTALRLSLGLYAGSLIPVALAPTLATLAIAMLGGGVAAATADTAMNAEAVRVERAFGRSIMSGLHGMWSIGGLAAGGIAAVLARAGVDGRAHFAAIAIGLVAVALVAPGWLLASGRARARDERGPLFVIPRGPVLLLGLLGFCAIFVENASADWAAVYLVRVLGTTPSLGAAGYAIFAGAMTVSRLAGDGAVRRYGATRTVRAAGCVGAAGGTAIVLAAHPAVAIAGFAAIGIGVATVVPLAFAAAGHAARGRMSSAHAIAGVATVAYGAGLAAPAVVGGIARATSLPMSFAVVTLLVLAVVIAAPVLASADAPAEDGEAPPDRPR
jgi:MFS family permease